MKVVIVCALACVFVLGCPVFSEAEAADDAAKRISLPEAEKTGGKPLMEALALRAADRKFSDKAVPDQVLSNLLWATWGVNRPDGRRTAPTALNSQAVEVYAALEGGVWRYDAAKHELALVLEGDVRSKFGGAPITLLYAVPEGDIAGGMHAGSLYQNAGLFCASAGLANVVKLTGARALDGVLKLPPAYRVIVIQSVGWPK